MNNITQEEYTRIMDEHDELVDLIITRAEELANILYGRDPIGTCCETDFDINDDGTLLVQFETYYCGDQDIDSYHLPLEFIFSGDYRNNYKTTVLNKRIDEERKRVDTKNAEIGRRIEEQEEHDQAEYERLRKKYEAIGMESGCYETVLPGCVETDGLGEIKKPRKPL